MGNCVAAEQVCHEECDSKCLATEEVCQEESKSQIIKGSVADIARYMSYMKPADARLEVTLHPLP